MLKPFDFYRKPPPQTFQQMLSKVVALVLGVFAISGMVVIFASLGRQQPKKDWDWEHRDIRRNFMPIYSTEENDRRFKEELDKTSKAFGFESPKDTSQPSAAANKPKLPGDEARPSPLPEDLPPPNDPAAAREAKEVARLSELTKGRWAVIEEEVGSIPTFTPFQDWRPQFRSHLKSEFDANEGRQAPAYEQLALRLLSRIPALGKPGRDQWDAKLESGKFWFGVGKEAVNAYRGRVFGVEGRLFDIYEVKLNPPVVLSDGSTFERYFEAVIAFLRPGNGHDELPITQQQVLVQMLQCPDALKPYLNSKGAVSQEDALAKTPVSVRLTGLYLRNFIYNRPVEPFHTKDSPVFCQSFLPLLLTADCEVTQRDTYAITDELLQQVRDTTRDDINYVQDEAAYYALLAQTNLPNDEPKVVPEVGYFDVSNPETGPKYRGQGIRVYGMLGDNYAPVILPPNISGLRRVFRVYVVASVTDLTSPNIWLVDMIDLPRGLEPRVAVAFNARYYRNVFETQDNRSTIRPLLVVHHVNRHYTSDTSQDWIFAVVLIAGAVLMFGLLAWFLFSDRRSVSKFEQQNMARLRERLEKHGGLKLKPLPKQGKEPDGPKPGPQPPSEKPAE